MLERTTIELDELHLFIEGRESTIYIYGAADISFDTATRELFVTRVTLTMEADPLDLAPRDPLFTLIERTLIEHAAPQTWAAIQRKCSWLNVSDAD